MQSQGLSAWVLAVISFVAVLAVGGVGIGIWKFQSSSGIAALASEESSADQTSLDVPATIPVSAPAGRQNVAAATRKKEEEKRAARQQLLQKEVIPFLTAHCADCHGPDSQEAGINVATLQNVDQFLPERKKWERVYRMINAGAMPPSDYDPQPDPEQKKKVADILYDELYNFDCELIQNPGRSTVQRLNRTEYNNTIRDLFGIDIRPADNFPADDVGEGFDNIGDVLTLPPLLMEKYLLAAEQVAEAVIDTTDYSQPLTIRYTADRLKARPSGGVQQGLRFLSTNGDVFGTFNLRHAGDYEIRIVVQGHQFGRERVRFALLADNKQLQEFQVKSDRKDESFTRRVQFSARPVRVTARFLNDEYVPKKGDRNFGVRSITLVGPLGGRPEERPPAHQRFVTATPGTAGNVRDAAFQVFQPFLKRAFRRPVTNAEVDRFARLVDRAVNEMGESYESGLSLALQAALVSPEFLFRLEQDPAPGQKERALNDYEVATRLSYFLWSTTPDDKLLQLADEGILRKPETLRQQISRMLQDDRADALMANFASQWLNLRNLSEVSPDIEKFPSFNEDLRNAMRRETELLFRSIMKEDRSVLELLSADYTFVNQKLAEHYGLKGIQGDEFQRVSLQGTGRSGVLTHASILTLTSAPERTSPVKRGKWILENIFGEAPPPPPPNVPELEVTAKASPDASLREQLELHRTDPGCASCHRIMDPLGLGFENFDAIGRWRDTDDGKPIDASGELDNGQTFHNSLELIALIQQQKDKYLRTLTEKMLTYATGRGMHHYDRCTVEQCLALMKQKNYRFSSLVEGIVLSDAFLKRAAVDAASGQ